MPDPLVRFPAGSLAEQVRRGEPVEPVASLQPVRAAPPPSNHGAEIFKTGEIVLEPGGGGVGVMHMSLHD